MPHLPAVNGHARGRHAPSRSRDGSADGGEQTPPRRLSHRPAKSRDALERCITVSWKRDHWNAPCSEPLGHQAQPSGRLWSSHRPQYSAFQLLNVARPNQCLRQTLAVGSPASYSLIWPIICSLGWGRFFTKSRESAGGRSAPRRRAVSNAAEERVGYLADIVI